VDTGGKQVTGGGDRAVVVFSGGQDSTTCLFWAVNRYDEVRAVTFSYSQVHGREIECARTIAEKAGVEHETIPLEIFKHLNLSSLVQGGEPVEHSPLPDTFVPGRNILFLAYTAAAAYKAGIRDIVTGVSQVDYSGYPDCREETIRSLERTLVLGMDYPFRIVTPLIHLSKAETVKLARAEGCFDMLAFTHTCYRGAYPPCGECKACILRAKGFREVGEKDPLLEAL